MQKKAFGILSLKEIDNAIIVNLKTPPKTASELKAIVERAQNRLRYKLIKKHWDKLGDILARVPGWDTLPDFMRRQRRHNYCTLVYCAKMAIIYPKRMKETNGGTNLDAICQDGFFNDVMKETGVDNDKKLRIDILSLLTIDEIADSLASCGFYKQKGRKINEFINEKRDCIDRLRDKVIEKHWDELGIILVEATGLKELYGFMKAKGYHGYYLLLESIRETISFEKLIKAKNNGSNLDAICSNAFFDDLEKEIGVEIGERIRNKFSNLLSIEEIAHSLTIYDFHKEKGQEINEFINRHRGCKESLCRKIAQKHQDNLGKTLAEALELKELFGLMKKEYYHRYYSLAECIRKAKEDISGLLSKLKITENRSSSDGETFGSSSSFSDDDE